jgi:hypothetical protein
VKPSEEGSRDIKRGTAGQERCELGREARRRDLLSAVLPPLSLESAPRKKTALSSPIKMMEGAFLRAALNRDRMRAAATPWNISTNSAPLAAVRAQHSGTTSAPYLTGITP